MRQSTRATRAIQRPRRIARAPDDSRSVACPSPKLYPACIFNYFLRPPAARSDDAILRLRRSQSPVRTPVVASLSAPAHPYTKVTRFWRRTGLSARESRGARNADQTVALYSLARYVWETSSDS